MIGIDLSCKTPLLQYSEDDVKAILKVHGKTLEVLGKDIVGIRKWAQQEYVTLVPCDRKILSLMILNDCDVEKTKKALDMSYALKSLMPEFFVLLPKDETLIHFAKAHNLFPLPKLTKNHKRLFVSQAVTPELFNGDGYITIILQISELCLIQDFNDGMEYIIDYGLFTKNILQQLSLPKLKKLYIFLEEVYSKKILPIHGINLSEEAIEFIRDREKSLIEPGETMYSHKDKGFEVLHEFYSKDILPKDYGGNLKTLAEYREDWIKHLQENNDYLEKIQEAEIPENSRIREIKVKEFEIFRINIEE